MDSDCGYLEFEHTADWGLRVWGKDLIQLLICAAGGMFDLMESKVDHRPSDLIPVEINAKTSPENLLVDFLNELLYLSEREKISLNEFHLSLKDGKLVGDICGYMIISYGKEIKAVTFHNLNVTETGSGFEAVQPATGGRPAPCRGDQRGTTENDPRT